MDEDEHFHREPGVCDCEVPGLDGGDGEQSSGGATAGPWGFVDCRGGDDGAGRDAGGPGGVAIPCGESPDREGEGERRSRVDHSGDDPGCAVYGGNGRDDSGDDETLEGV